MAEKRFAKELLQNIEKYSKNEIKFKHDPSLIESRVTKDTTDFGDLRANLISDNNDSYIVDSIIIKGVSPNRDENDSNFDYELMKNKDNEGMRFYFHKYFTGHMHYYQHLKYK